MSSHATAVHREVFRKGSRTYFNSSLFFPREVRDDVSVLYAFVRTADDFVDATPQDPAGFAAFRSSWERARAGAPVNDLIVASFAGLARRRSLEPAWVDAFFASMEMDLHARRYETLEETLQYIYGSAEVIGLFMAQLMGLPPESHHGAMRLGRSMQYINFVRDIHEDLSLGRTYLPLAGSGLPDLTEETARRRPAEFLAFVRRQLDLYRGWQAEAEAAYRFLPRRFLIPVRTAADMYNWTAAVIAADPFVVYRRKVKPGRMRILLQILRNASRGLPRA
jgi:15-cis-phytoene synthase